MTHLTENPPTDSVSVRRYLCDALRIDLVGPRPGDAALQHERLPQAPSRWYLAGFLAPGDAPEEQLAQDSEEALDEPAEPLHGGGDASTPDRGSHKRIFLPSSMGLSMLVDEETKRLAVAVSWGDYAPETADTPEIADTSDAAGGPEATGAPEAADGPGNASGLQDVPAESVTPAAREDGGPLDATAAAHVASGLQDAPDKPAALAAREGEHPPEDGNPAEGESPPEGENPPEDSRRARPAWAQRLPHHRPRPVRGRGGVPGLGARRADAVGRIRDAGVDAARREPGQDVHAVPAVQLRPRGHGPPPPAPGASSGNGTSYTTVTTARGLPDVWCSQPAQGVRTTSSAFSFAAASLSASTSSQHSSISDTSRRYRFMSMGGSRQMRRANPCRPV